MTIINLPIDKSRNSKIKILTIYDEGMEIIINSIYFGNDWKEDLRRIRETLGNKYHYILTDGIYA